MLSVIGKNAVKKGDLIFREGEKITQLGIVLSGRVQMRNSWMSFVRPQGSFLAINDVNEEGYTADYIALEDSVVFAIPFHGEDTIREVAAKNADFRAIMVSSQFKFVTHMSQMRSVLYDHTYHLYQFTKKKYEEYLKLCSQEQLQVIELSEIDGLKPYEKIQAPNEERIPYYEEASKIPLSANKLYFSYSEEMVTFQTLELLSLIENMKDDCLAMIEYVKALMSVLGLRASHNLFEYCCVQGVEMRRKGNVPREMKGLLEEIIEELRIQYEELKNYISTIPAIDFSLLEKKAANVVSQEMTASELEEKEERDAAIQRDVLSLKNTMEQVIKYGALDDANSEILRANVEYLVKAPDRLSVEDDVKKAKKAITPIVFTLYLNCYRTYVAGLTVMPKAVELFLNYGLLDERLVDEELLTFLCGLREEPNEGPCQIFTMVEWLDQIRTGKREASKSEFDEDYVENLRSLRKQGEITEEEQKKLLGDMDKRVEYEVMNMQKANTKTLYGQPSAYMPILYKEAILGHPEKVLVTKCRLNESIQNVVRTDFSVFYREVIYSNTQLKISNETVMKEVYPDIILFPLAGINAAMWQEVGGKNKATPGRFCYPALCSGNLDELTVKLCGRFRWELCRCIQGMSWNDVKVKSLTSEYMDYIQFYRKNRDLSDEAREKVKLQIQKGRNNSREVFLLDYEVWVRNESNGSMKLNKVSRELLATYCPFEKTLREKLGVQRPYEAAQARYIRTAQKKKQEFELKIKAIQKETDEIPEEIATTYKLYAEL